MRINPFWEMFNAGEFSPWMIGRVGFDKYPFGLEICENLIPMIEGPVTRRPGTRFVAGVKTNAEKVRLVRFEFSTVQAYILEFGKTYIRFYRHQGQIQSGGAPYEIASPYTEADLPNLRFVQSADVLFVFHPSYQTRKLSRSAHTSWTLSTIAWTDGPYLDTNITATTLNPSAATGTITITASAVTGINGGSGFLSTDVGRLIRLSNPASGVNWGYATITAISSTTVVTATVNRAFATVDASADWRLGSWSGTTGYPKLGIFFQQRLVMAGTTNQPQTVWLSQTDDFENMSPDSEVSSAWDGTVEDDDAFDRTISSDEVNAIVWLAPLRSLVVGTTGGEWVTSSDGNVATPDDLSIERHARTGSADMPPVVVGNRILYLQRAKRKLIELGFNFEDDAFRDADMTRISRHITVGGITRIVYAAEPHRLICCVRADGVMACVSYNRQENVVGWFRVVTDGIIEDVAVIPGANGAGQTQDSSGRDEIWVVVKRNIDGSDVRYVEVFERDFENGHNQEDAYYADSMLTYDGVATSTISGLAHLEDEEVVIWADGAKQPNQTVASGAITLDKDAEVVQVGLPFTHRMKTLKANYGAAAGTSVSKPKRFHALSFVLLNSHTMNYGPDADTLNEIDFRVVSDKMDEAVPLFTGEFRVDFDGDWDTDSRVYLEDDTPAPFTLLAIAPELRTNELI